MTLEETFTEINNIIGNNAEPLESVRLVETYRQYLKPETVRVVLLGESHVFTSDEDRRIAIPPIDDLPGYPTQYARFVYCLGYGERILTLNSRHPRGDGTPQFWLQVVTSANPEHVICVGIGVADIVEKDLRALFPNRYTVIPQPNAYLSSKAHMANFQRYYEICNA